MSSFQQAMTKEKALEMFSKMTKDCAAKEGGTAADLEEALARKPPSTTSGKCMSACVLEGPGIVNHLYTYILTEINSWNIFFCNPFQ